MLHSACCPININNPSLNAGQKYDKQLNSFVTVTTTTTPIQCSGTLETPPAGYDGHSGKYYKAFTTKKNFHDALEICHQDGATLAEYQTAADYSVIEHYQGKLYANLSYFTCRRNSNNYFR